MTVKQRKFAKLVATGVSLTEAHVQAYGKGNGKRKTKTVDACKLAVKPKVKAEIARIVATLEPIGDWHACKQRMLSNMQYLATESPDHRVRLAATKMLHDICQERERLESARAKTINVESLIQEIGQLQAPAAESTIELETESPDGAENAAAAPAEDSEDSTELEPNE